MLRKNIDRVKPFVLVCKILQNSLSFLGIKMHLVYIVTVRNSSCGKVMFSQACVKNSVHRGEGVYTPPRQTTPPPQADTPTRQTPPLADTP